MEFNPAIPIYLQIMERIKKDIVTGILPSGERIESVRSLAEKFGVNLNTIQRACAELEREQIITTQRGIGSFVTEDQGVIMALKENMSADMINDFWKECRALDTIKMRLFFYSKRQLKNDTILSVKNLTKYYRRKPVLNNLSFEVQTGRVVGLMGPNGAGENNPDESSYGIFAT